MILKKVLDIKHNIIKHQKELFKIAKEKGLSDQEVLAISRKLDEDLLSLQKLINKIL